MKTDIDLKKDLYDHLRATALVGSVSGKLLMTTRPTTSDKEDIVISVLASSVETDIQLATLNVNIYVSDYRTEEGDDIEASLRLRKLARLAYEALEVGQGASGCRFEIVSQRILKVEGRNEHCINNRILYKQLIKQ